MKILSSSRKIISTKFDKKIYMLTLTVTLPKRLEKQLEYLEKTTGKSKEFFCQEALTQYLEDVEDLYMALKVKEQKLYTTQELLDSLKLRKNVSGGMK